MRKLVAPRARAARWALVGILLLSWGTAAAAQARTAVPIRTTHAPIDSVSRRYHDALWVVRDSLAAVREAVEQFERDHAGVSRETVLSRAAVLVDHCGAATRTLKEKAVEFVVGPGSPKPPAQRSALETLGREMRTLRTALDADCIVGFATRGPGQRADSLRAWAGYRGSRIERALASYDLASGRFLKAMNIQMEAAQPRR